MEHYFYRSEDPTVITTVRSWYEQRAAFDAARIQFGKVFGAEAARMKNIDSFFVGGLKLSASRDLDVHWCRPDDFGYRSLRAKVIPPKGTPKEERAAMRAEHERLQSLWAEHCPKRISNRDTWHQLGINTGNILMCGGINFELEGVAYFHLGFPIDKAKHLASAAAGKPTSGWIEGAVEIVRSEYSAAADLKNANNKGAGHES